MKIKLETILFAFKMLLIVFRNFKTFLNMNPFIKSDFRKKDVFIYKMLEILLITQFYKKHSEYSNKKILREVQSDLYQIYLKYFKTKT